MNYIDITSEKIEKAKEVHYEYISYIIKNKIRRNKKPKFEFRYWDSETSDYLKSKQINRLVKITKRARVFLSKDIHLRKILIGKPEDLDIMKSHSYLKNTENNRIDLLFNYKKWRDSESYYEKYNAYNLAKNLDIPTCPYCGRMYTKTVVTENGEKKTRPQFDHWYPQSKYPLLALSFYNLVPSCNICNSTMKSADEFSLNTHFHPYYQSTNKSEKLDIRFSYEYEDYNLPQIKVRFNKENDFFSKNSVEAFSLDEIYKTHQDELEDLIKLRQIYSDTYLAQLQKMANIKISMEELYRLAFGAHIRESEFDRRPLSRMKRDILLELGIIKTKKSEF